MLEMTEEDYIKTLTEEFTKTYGKPVSDSGTGVAGPGEESSGKGGEDRKVVDTDYYGKTTYTYIPIYFSVCVEYFFKVV